MGSHRHDHCHDGGPEGPPYTRGCRLRGAALMKDHPVNPEAIPQLTEPGGKEGFLQFHEDLPTVRQCRKDALRFRIAVNSQRQIGTAHRLRGRDIGAPQGRPTDFYSCVADGLVPCGIDTAWPGRLAVLRHHHDPAAQMLFVEMKCLCTLATKIHVRMHVHAVLRGVDASFSRHPTKTSNEGGWNRPSIERR